jgi:hypothetical protein
MRAEETKERWATMLEKQDKKIALETARVAVKNWKEDFLILTTDMSGMDEEVKAVHMLYGRRHLSRNRHSQDDTFVGCR